MSLSINSFVKRQQADSPFTHFEGSWDEVAERIVSRMGKEEFIRPGYRDGVILISIDPAGFWTGTVKLEDGDVLIGKYSSRQVGEAPRRHIYVRAQDGHKKPAMFVQAVLYSHAVLLETGENETEADYELISINGYPDLDEAPIHYETLMHNHFGSEGGTATGMDSQAFEAALKESFNYWKNHGTLE